jgi:hypothetical protein
MPAPLTDDQMFGPTSLDGAKPFFSQFNLFPGHTRGAPPFRKGQMVTQTSGPHASRNQRCEVEDVAYVTNSEFTGWAIRLVGRASPYAAEHFEALSGTPEPGTVVASGGAFVGVADRQNDDGTVYVSFAPRAETSDRYRDYAWPPSVNRAPKAEPPATPEPPAPSVRRRIVRRNKK